MADFFSKEYLPEPFGAFAYRLVSRRGFNQERADVEIVSGNSDTTVMSTLTATSARYSFFAPASLENSVLFRAGFSFGTLSGGSLGLSFLSFTVLKASYINLALSNNTKYNTSTALVTGPGGGVEICGTGIVSVSVNARLTVEINMRDHPTAFTDINNNISAMDRIDMVANFSTSSATPTVVTTFWAEFQRAKI